MNPLLTPELGTYVWSLVIFMTVLFVLRKYAWNPLLDFLEEREKDIAESLKMAESAKTDVEQIKDALERDNFMTPENAKDFGLIDQVVEKRI